MKITDIVVVPEYDLIYTRNTPKILFAVIHLGYVLQRKTNTCRRHNTHSDKIVGYVNVKLQAKNDKYTTLI